MAAERCVVWSIACFLMYGCQSGYSRPDIDRTGSELVARAIAEQRFIEGGTFVMGGFGAVQDGQWLPYFPPTAERNKAHNVELTSFSLSAYETTWGDYDTYSLIHGESIAIRGGGEERPREPYIESLEHTHRNLSVGIASFSCMAAMDEIPGYAVEMGSKRVDVYLFRYTRFNAESPFPCLRFELIAPQAGWGIVERKDICEMNGKKMDGDFSYASFDSFRFENNLLLFRFSFF